MKALKNFKEMSGKKKAMVIAGVAAVAGVLIAAWRIFTPIDEEEEFELRDEE